MGSKGWRGEWYHNSMGNPGGEFRCPHCGELHDLDPDEDYEMYEEGEHEYWCSECDKCFTVSTMPYWTWTSPALKEK